MKWFFGAAGAIFLISTFSSAAYADPPHRGGLPPGLQKKIERGQSLPPGWQKKSGAYEYGYYEEPYYDEPYSDQYEPEPLEDKVVRIIRDVRDLTSSFAR